MFCGNCGIKLAEDARFCPACGAPQQPVQPQQPAYTASPRKKKGGKLALILIPVGIIYIAETGSVILQVTYFKATHGKRLFKMSPLHHHMELCGWSEKKLVAVFSGITLACCVLAWLGIQGRY